MPIKAIVDKLEDLPADVLDRPLREFFVQRDGKFHADFELPTGDVERLKRALDSERSLGSSAARERDALKSRAAELEAKLQQITTPSADGELPEALKKQLEPFVKQHSDRIASLEKSIKDEQDRRSKAESSLKQSKIEDVLRAAAVAAGVREEAIPDALNRTRDGWDMDDQGRIVRKDDQGNPAYSSDDPTKLLTAREFVGKMIPKEAAHLLKPSTGANILGANGNTGRGAIVLSEAEARDPQRYRQAREQAAKAGQEVQIAQAGA